MTNPYAENVEIPEISDDKLLERIIKCNSIVVCYFSKNYLTCQRFETDIIDYANRYHKQIQFIKIDVEQYPQFEKKYKIRVYPTTIIYINSVPVKSIGGAPKYGLKRYLSPTLANKTVKLKRTSIDEVINWTFINSLKEFNENYLIIILWIIALIFMTIIMILFERDQ